jgi:hypothetical protein
MNDEFETSIGTGNELQCGYPIDAQTANLNGI